MIPIHLSIEGLYSYQERQEIDFTQLTSAQLFGIFGTTGSGKSSILEAITFALYAQSDRLNQKDNRGYNMMNLRSNQLLIEFRFESEGTVYLFSVRGKRNSKQFQKVKTLERSAYKIENGNPIPLDHTSAEEILGLSYENFRRTVIVPQGKFQEFLQLTDTERTRMMREIFRLERFELYRKTQNLEQRTAVKIAQTSSLIAQYPNVTIESVEAKNLEVQAAQKRLTSLEQELKIVEQSFQEQETLRQLFADLHEQQRIIGKLTVESAEMLNRKERLEAYERCLLSFKPLLDRKKEFFGELENIEGQLAVKNQNQTEVQQELSRIEVQFEKIAEEYQKRDQWTQMADELRIVIQLKKRESNVQALLKRIADGKAKITGLKEDIGKHKQEQAKREQELKALRDNRPNLKELMPIRDWYQQLEHIQKNLSRAEQEALHSQSRKDELVRNKQQLLSEAKVSPAQYSLPSIDLIQLLSTRREEAQAHIAASKIQYEALLSHKQLEEFIDQLTEGEPCPLCGSLHHPEPLSTEDQQDSIIQVKQEIKEGEAKLQVLQAILAKLEAIQSQEDTLQLAVQDRQNRLREIQISLDQHRSSFQWSGEMTDDRVKLELEAINKTDTLTKEIILQREALLATLTQKEDTLELWRKGLEKITQDHKAEEVAFLSQQKSLKHIPYEARKVDADAATEELALEYDQNYKRLEQSYRSVETQVKQLRSRKDSLLGEIKGLEEQSKHLHTQLAQKNLELDRTLQKSPFQNLEEIHALLALNLDIEEEKRVIREFEQAKHAATLALAGLEEKAKGKTFSQENFEQTQANIQTLSRQKSACMIEVGSLQKERERLTTDLAFKQEQEQRLKQQESRAANLATLKNMFKSSGFVSYVSTVYLQNLCAAANDRFMKLTRGALSLETTDSNAFLIRDYLNNGQTRSAKTLSGGQTFQAALSLALALADQVQQQNKSKQNFFFLDEGFGSQDKESLQVILQTLKSLRKENRIVGIISHVEELQQDIGAFLHIHNDGETGSLVKGSWE